MSDFMNAYMAGLQTASKMKIGADANKTAEIKAVVDDMHRAHAEEDAEKTRRLSNILTTMATAGVSYNQASDMVDNKPWQAPEGLPSAGLSGITPGTGAAAPDNTTLGQGGVLTLPPISPDEKVPLPPAANIVARQMEAQQMGSGPNGRFANRQQFIDALNRKRAEADMPPQPTITAAEAGMPSVEGAPQSSDIVPYGTTVNGQAVPTFPPATAKPPEIFNPATGQMSAPASETSTTESTAPDDKYAVKRQAVETTYSDNVAPYVTAIDDYNAQIKAAAVVEHKLASGEIDPRTVSPPEERNKQIKIWQDLRDTQQKEVDRLEKIKTSAMANIDKEEHQALIQANSDRTYKETTRHNQATETPFSYKANQDALDRKTEGKPSPTTVYTETQKKRDHLDNMLAQLGQKKTQGAPGTSLSDYWTPQDIYAEGRAAFQAKIITWDELKRLDAAAYQKFYGAPEGQDPTPDSPYMNIKANIPTNQAIQKNKATPKGAKKSTAELVDEALKSVPNKPK